MSPSIGYSGIAESTGACEKCGREVAGISASAPGRRTLDPCGHETGFLTAKQRMLRDSETTSEEYSLRTDGGEDLSEVSEEVLEATEAVREEIESMSDAELREHLKRSGGDGR